MGGSIDGVYSLGVLIPHTSFMAGTFSSALPPQPWIPLDAAINSILLDHPDQLPEDLDSADPQFY